MDVVFGRALRRTRGPGRVVEVLSVELSPGREVAEDRCGEGAAVDVPVVVVVDDDVLHGVGGAGGVSDPYRGGQVVGVAVEPCRGVGVGGSGLSSDEEAWIGAGTGAVEHDLAQNLGHAVGDGRVEDLPGVGRGRVLGRRQGLTLLGLYGAYVAGVVATTLAAG